MMNGNDITIVPAQEGHLPQIVALSESYLLSEMDPEEAGNMGFLVSRFEIEDYAGFLSRADHFYVLLEKGRVIGFLLAYSRDGIESHEWLNLRIKGQYKNPFVLIKQVCISPDSSGKGLAKYFYRYLFEKVPDNDFFGAIVLEPLNSRSIAFHERMGFTKVLEATPPDGLLRGVWMKKGTD